MTYEEAVNIDTWGLIGLSLDWLTHAFLLKAGNCAQRLIFFHFFAV
jgi:hypothetical protein